MSNAVQPATARDAVSVTKSDTTTYTDANGGAFDALWIGGAGDVAVRTIRGNTTTFAGASAGQIVPIKCDRVMSTNTTATNIVGLRY